MLGRDTTAHFHDELWDAAGWTKYFRFSLNHKIVGQQYVVGVLMFFFTAGLLAMAYAASCLPRLVG